MWSPVLLTNTVLLCSCCLAIYASRATGLLSSIAGVMQRLLYSSLVSRGAVDVVDLLLAISPREEAVTRSRWNIIHSPDSPSA